MVLVMQGGATEGKMTFQRIGIIGVGLIGGSLGLALKRAAPSLHILGIGRSQERLQLAQELGAIDGFSVETAGSLRDRDLVFLATPVEHILATLETLGGRLSPGTIVTDVGSTKRLICRQAWRQLPKSVEFIGGHPVAGREMGGVENSSADLFEDAPYILCPPPGSQSANLASLRSLVGCLGSLPRLMSPEKHDRAIARVSHLPQLLSTALANVGRNEETAISGSGFQDMLRLAGSPYSMWKGILESNADNIDQALQEYISHLEQMRSKLESGRSLSDDFDRAGELYQSLQRRKRGSPRN